MTEWAVVYEKAIKPDGSLLFPNRLTQKFLEDARRVMGSYVFANQYQNEIIPDGEQTFKKHWIRYYKELPEHTYRFAFVDPAISEADTADYTALSVVSVDTKRNWYVEIVRRERLNPSQIIGLLFETFAQYHPLVIGIEDVAFQRALLHFTIEEMKRRGQHIPIAGVKRSPDKSKEMRILGLVPRFEWGSCLLSTSCQALEDELASFPRGAHDDCLDSLASIEDIVFYPEPRINDATPTPNDPRYESWYRKQRLSGKSVGNSLEPGW